MLEPLSHYVIFPFFSFSTFLSHFGLAKQIKLDDKYTFPRQIKTFTFRVKSSDSIFSY